MSAGVGGLDTKTALPDEFKEAAGHHNRTTHLSMPSYTTPVTHSCCYAILLLQTYAELKLLIL